MQNDERERFSERLNSALDQIGVPPKGRGRQGRVAKMFDVSQKGARKWLEGEAIPKTSRLREMAEKLGVSTEWLLTGDGPKRYPDAGAVESNKMDPAVADHHEVLSIIAELMGDASPRSRQVLIGLVEAAERGELSEDDLVFIEQVANRIKR